MNNISKEFKELYDRFFECGTIEESISIYKKMITESNTPNEINTCMYDNRLIKKINLCEAISYNDVMPYFTPLEMEYLGVFNNDPSRNAYKVKSNNESRWFQYYKKTEYPPTDYYANLTKAYWKYENSRKTNEDKQELLEWGWNPEVELNDDTLANAAFLTKNKLGNNIRIIDATLI